MQNGKDTVYVDVDDEITGIIDKVTGSKQKIVALVLPKRAGVLQSSVNMKLLKRSADNASKNVVLITTEAALMPLAGAAGIHVAKTPLSKPELPVSPIIRDSQMPIDEGEALQLDDEPERPYTAENAANRPVGELAKGTAGAAAIGTAPSAIETVELDDPETPAKAAAATDAASKKAAKGKQPKIPNFGKFQKRLVIAGFLLLVLIAGLIVANVVLPKATIAIATDATDYNSSLDITLDSAASDVSTDKNTIPATVEQQQKSYTQQVAATGQQNNGDKATGSVDMTTCVNKPSSIHEVPAGTVITADGLTYLTQDDTNFQYSPGSSDSSCFQFKSKDIAIAAQKGGANYNASSGTSFKVNGRSDVTATGSASGGTDDITKIVTQSDIDNATGQLKNQDTTNIKSVLVQQLRQNNLYPIQTTFSSGTPTTTSSSKAGDTADAVTVTQNVTYTMYGAKREYLDQLIQNDIKQQIDPTTQTILNDGLDEASIKTSDSTDTTAKINLATTATVGPHLDIGNLKDQIKGKKAGYVKSVIGNHPGVTNVTVKLSPFWVGSVPKKTTKITITVDKASQNDAGSN